MHSVLDESQCDRHNGGGLKGRCRAAGLDGLGMLVSQGAISIRHWTGIEPEFQVMRRKLEHIFGV